MTTVMYRWHESVKSEVKGKGQKQTASTRGDCKGGMAYPS